MSVETIRKIMTAYLDALTERGPLAHYFADDAVFKVMGGDQQVQGAEAIESFIVWLHQHAFDARPDFKALIVANDQATLEADFVGQHIGEFFGVPASKHNVRVPYAVVYDLRDEKITELRFYMPMNVLMDQINTATPALATV